MKVKKIIIILLCMALCLSTIGCNKVPEGYLPESEDGMMFDVEDYQYFYNYAPTVIVEGNVAHVWYCTNIYSAIAGDHIAYRRGEKINGRWFWSELSIVLYPGQKGEWDCKHICDPSVIKGEFLYNQKKYGYLMAYLGCMTDGNYENSFGFAVAEKPEGPWVKVPEVSPLIDFYSTGGENGKMMWGTGQPSVVSVDKKGKILVFYTKHAYPNEWGTMVERWDFSNLNQPVKDFSVHLSNTGLKNKEGKQDFITVADFAYDQYRKVIYVGTDVHPFGDEYPNNITDTSRVARADVSADLLLGDTFKKGVKWQDVYYVTKDDTGRGKNTNLGFFRDPYGWLVDKNKIDIAVSASQSSHVESWQLFFTLKLYRVEKELY